jgi:hypothetical protein
MADGLFTKPSKLGQRRSPLGVFKVAKKRCYYCGRLFTSDPGVGHFQKVCSMQCQRLRKKGYNGYYDEVPPKKVKQILDGTGYPTVDLCGFGYAISVHRTQGSEWDNVLLFKERSQYWDAEFYKRWL